MDGYYTVVYKVTGEKAAHDAWWQSVRPLFMAADEKPVSITAISVADEITRLNCIEAVAERRDGRYLESIEEIREILVHMDPRVWWDENAEKVEP
jgi:hypothetical protein